MSNPMPTPFSDQEIKPPADNSPPLARRLQTILNELAIVQKVAEASHDPISSDALKKAAKYIHTALIYVQRGQL